MSNRKLIRPDAAESRRDSSSRSIHRKQTPPEQTNAEEYYYLKQMASKTPMVVILDNDEELRGWIEWYDKGSIKLNRTRGPNLLIQKRHIRYLFKEEELRRGGRRITRSAKAEAESSENGGSESAETSAVSDDSQS